MEHAVVTNYEDINDEIIMDDDDSFASEIDPLQNGILEVEEMDNINEGREIEGLDA